MIEIEAGGIPLVFVDGMSVHYAVAGHGRGRLLTPSEVYHIRRRYFAEGATSRHVADEYGIARRTVFRIVSGESYPHVPFPTAAQDHPQHEGRALTYRDLDTNN